MSNETVYKNIMVELNKLDSIQKQIEVLANVFLQLGVSFITPDTQTPVKPENALTLILEDKDKNGETIGNALATQGLILLSWLDV